MKFMRQVGDGEASLVSKTESSDPAVASTASSWAHEFAHTWGDDLTSNASKSAAWEEEFGKKYGGESCLFSVKVVSP